MEEKLLAYRRRKRQKEMLLNFKNKLLKMISFTDSKENVDKKSCVIEPMPDDSSAKKQNLSDADSASYSDEADEFPDEEPLVAVKNNWLTYALWIAYFLFWATCYAIAIELKFGLVYLVISALCGIYFNTRTGPKRRNEISAYSVFNKGCESIDGTLKAEQFEREIRYGPNSVR